jgi:cyclohexanone monooxygenase
MAEHISYLVGEARSRGHAVVEASEQAEAAWADMVASTASERQTEFLRSCTPGYYNNEGNLESRTRQGSARLGGGSVAYHEILRGWRSAGTLSGLDCS